MNYEQLIELYFSLLSIRNQHLLSIWCAERVLTKYAVSNSIFLRALTTKKRWIERKINNETLGKVRDRVWEEIIEEGSKDWNYIVLNACRVSILPYRLYESDSDMDRRVVLCYILKMLGEQIKK